MHRMHRWFLLRHYGPDRSYRHLLNWEILDFFSFSMYKLSRWDLSSNCWLHCVRFMYFRIVLCHNRLNCSDRCLLNWEILIFISFGMYKLSCWDL